MTDTLIHQLQTLFQSAHFSFLSLCLPVDTIYLMARPGSENEKRVQESAAVVLECREHGESDLIVTFFCSHQGKLTGIAKGAKRSKKRFVNKLELFSSLIIGYTLSQKRSLAFIAEAELLESFLQIRTNIACYTAASIIREFILCGTQEMEGDQDLYPLLVWALHNLNTGSPPHTVLTHFLIRFFTTIGYSPQLNSCMDCGTATQQGCSYFFDPSAGSICCSNCRPHGSASTLPLSLGTLKSLASAQAQPLERLQRLHLSSGNSREALTFLHLYGRRLFQREIISWSSLDLLKL